MPSCSHSCRALALERVKAYMAITAARYTRQETLPALLLRYCPIFSLGWSASVFPLKPRIIELRRPSRYMEASYMEAPVYFSFKVHVPALISIAQHRSKNINATQRSLEWPAQSTHIYWLCHVIWYADCAGYSKLRCVAFMFLERCWAILINGFWMRLTP